VLVQQMPRLEEEEEEELEPAAPLRQRLSMLTAQDQNRALQSST